MKLLGHLSLGSLLLLQISVSNALPAAAETSHLEPRDHDLVGIDLSQIHTCGNDIAGIKRTLREVNTLAQAALDTHFTDPAFTKYFGKGWDSTPARTLAYAFIKANMRKAGSFPLHGNTHQGKSPKILVRCSDCKEREKRRKGRVAASLNHHADPTTLTLCPSFFDRPHLLDRVKGSHTPHLNNLVTREHVLLHELFHADIIGTDEHIQDVNVAVTLPGTNKEQKLDIYGVQACAALGKKKNGGNSPSILAKKNADSYVWWATTKFFDSKWGIDMDAGDGAKVEHGHSHNELRAVVEGADIYDDEGEIVEYGRVPDFPGDGQGSDEPAPAPAPPSPPPPSPPPSQPNLSCRKDCCGFVPNPDWCNANCHPAHC